jgi:hypothetical protein
MRPLDPFLDPQVQAAVLAGLFLAAGWLVNGRANRRVAADLRDERVRDVLRALHSEIRAYVAVLRRNQVGTNGAALRDRIRDEAGFFPFVPSERNATIFSTIVGDISILPDNTIHPIVLYYTQIDTIEALINDLRSLDIARSGQARAAELYADFMLVKIEAAELGADALAAIARFLDYVPAQETYGMAEWVATERAAINTLRGSDRSAR